MDYWSVVDNSNTPNTPEPPEAQPAPPLRDPNPITSPEMHLERRTSFDAFADAYRHGRPGYPDAVFAILAERCGLAPGARVLEIGPGTGQATGPILAVGAEVTAVEPGANLAAVLEGAHPGAPLTVVNSDFETAEIPGGGFDLAVAATSFHWIAKNEPAPKLASLVRPGGWLAVWWTVFGDTTRPTPFRDRLDSVYADLMPGEPGYRDSSMPPLDAQKWYPILTRGGHFGDVRIDVIPWWQRMTAESARALWATFSNVAGLPADDNAAFLRRLGETVEEFGGAVDDPRLTVVYTAQRSKGRAYSASASRASSTIPG